MNHDNIITLAREAGFTSFDALSERLHTFAALVAAAEREACARVCEDIEMRNTLQGPADCAVAIRERST